MQLVEVYRKAKVVNSGNHYTTVNEFTDQIPALRPSVLLETAQKVIQVGDFAVDKIVTEEEKGAALAAVVSVLSGVPLSIARWYNYSLDCISNAAKIDIKSEYYEGTLYLNGIAKEDKVTIVDDTLSTGGALISLIKAVRACGGEVKDAICVVEKIGNNGKENVLAETGVDVKTLLKIRVNQNTVEII